MSQGGQGTSTTSASESLYVTVRDTAANGTDSSSTSSSGTSNRGVGGSSRVVVADTGIVGAGNVGGGSITSIGSTASSAAIGGIVDGSVTVNANGVVAGTSKSADAYARTVKAGVATTDTLSESFGSTSVTTAGAASADVTGIG